MSRRSLWLIALSTITLSLAACGSSGPKTVTLTEKDNGHAFDVDKGDRLEVVLPGNPSTGYQWEVSAGDTAILRPVGEPEFNPTSEALGSGGQMTLRFDAVGVGQVELELIFHRAFEKDVPPAQTFNVTVMVK